MIELNRHLAPISGAAWKRIEAQARDVLNVHLAARRIVEFEGPVGWETSALDLGRVELLEGAPDGGTTVRRRVVRPLIELRVPFALERAELERVDRGARRVDLEPLAEAARTFAAAEDTAVFEGYADADIPGLVTDAQHDGIALPKEPEQLRDAVSDALELLREAGVGGPYALALGPAAYARLDRAAAAGYPVLRHVQRLIDAPVVWAPSLRGGLVASLRGGDFKLVCGRDASIGYRKHDDEKVWLYLEESFSAEINGPEAVVPLLAA
ncbi:MAG: family 1 encapsulin nanocompartment shell protein [Myxococcota bacterium]|nr:bacteriocin family protein [Myxococcales bacterium]